MPCEIQRDFSERVLNIRTGVIHAAAHNRIAGRIYCPCGIETLLQYSSSPYQLLQAKAKITCKTCLRSLEKMSYDDANATSAELFTVITDDGLFIHKNVSRYVFTSNILDALTFKRIQSLEQSYTTGEDCKIDIETNEKISINEFIEKRQEMLRQGKTTQDVFDRYKWARRVKPGLTVKKIKLMLSDV